MSVTEGDERLGLADGSAPGDGGRFSVLEVKQVNGSSVVESGEAQCVVLARGQHEIAAVYSGGVHPADVGHVAGRRRVAQASIDTRGRDPAVVVGLHDRGHSTVVDP
ncbi:hypothetical protein ACQPX6_16870 [Actinomycetospora sp. CA-101289]|uniref:hypothetical protein n=1 Tax=Actinomycetospora sp. CA-101289 TaxID=3239893 RepID=UPI003D998266